MQHRDITAAEKIYLAPLKEECRLLFEGTSIPSHDHFHHERVWKNASLLLQRLLDAGMLSDHRMPEKAIIAAFFHDTGLTVNRGSDHGRESRNLCHNFLQETDIRGDELDEILDAVERHDDKTYAAKSDPASLAAIISVADDMDAFGEEGIGRYMEIYTMRGITDDEIPGHVISNVMSRFRHLESTYRMFPDLIDEQRVRFKAVTDYFTNIIK
jgi:HD superfamily phosphodiesterase